MVHLSAMSEPRSSAHRRASLALALCALLTPLACTKTPEPDPAASPARDTKAPEAHATPTQGAAAQAPKGPTEIGWDAPKGWEKAENPSPMRKATYKIPRAAGDTEDGELSVSQAGGTVDMNVNRWAGQFEAKGPEAVKREEKTVNGLKVSVVEIKGTFTGSGMPGGPAGAAKPSYALLGAIVETSGQLWFFKLTGPEKTLAAARGDFDHLVDSIRAK